MTTKLSAVLVEYEQQMRAWTVLHSLIHGNYSYSLKVKVMYTLHFITLADFQAPRVAISVDIILKNKQNC